MNGNLKQIKTHARADTHKNETTDTQETTEGPSLRRDSSIKSALPLALRVSCILVFA